MINKNVDISSNLYVNGDVSFQRNLDVSGKIITTDLTTLNDTSLNGAVTIEGRLDVSNVVKVILNVVKMYISSFKNKYLIIIYFLRSLILLCS